MKTLLLLAAVFCGLTSHAQDYRISFKGSGGSSTISSVKIENLTKGTEVTISDNVTLYLTSVTGIKLVENQSSALKIYPNPTVENTVLEFVPPVAGNAVISVYDISGIQFAGYENFLVNTIQKFRLSCLNTGTYLISVRGRYYHFSERMISLAPLQGTPTIERINETGSSMNKVPQIKSRKEILNDTTINFEYSTGDRLKFTGISGNYSTVIVDTPNESKTITFDFVGCTDGDKNNYPVVKIGEQLWMAENLKTTKYNDGTPIPNRTVGPDTPDSWMNSEDAYCSYNNDTSLLRIYGGLYKLETLKSGKLCPAGWHAPDNDEWEQLSAYLGGSNNAGGKLKETGTLHWKEPNQGATNESGFTALPGGIRDWGGSFKALNNEGIHWSVSKCDGPGGCGWRVFNSTTDFDGVDYESGFGLSVRCIFGEK